MSDNMQETPLDVAPYYDDYDSDKNFHRVLFKAGQTVQARELNQIQDIGQDQVNRFGKNIFAEGSIVIPGGITVKTDQDSIKLFFDTGFAFTDIQNSTATLYIKGKTSGTTAQVAKMIAQVGADPITFLIDYLSSGNSGVTNVFADNEDCTVYSLNSDGTQNSLSELTVVTATKTIWAISIPGTYFLRGNFVDAYDDNIVISKYADVTSAKVGFLIQEQIITSTDDRTLFSNALGEPNFKASGADRLKIGLTLATIAVTDQNKDFIEIVRLVDSAIQSNVTTSTYSLIEKSIATQTFETNGNYTVTPFGLQLKEHLKNSPTDINGVYLAANGGLESKFVAQLKPGTGYAGGYRTATVGIQSISIDKARSTTTVPNTVTSADYGPYIMVTAVHSFPDINIQKRIRFLNSSSVAIGTCAIRAFRRDSTSNYRLYVFDFQFTTGNTFNNVTKIDYQDSSNLFTANLVSAVIFDSSKDSMVFKLPYNSINSLKTGGISHTSYTVMRSMIVTTNASGVASVSVASNEIFGSINNFEYFICQTGASTPGAVIDPTTAGLVLSGSPVGRTLNINLSATYATQTIKIIAPIIKSAPVERTKILQSNSETFNLGVGGKSSIALAKGDIIGITSVMDGATDVTTLFTFDNGQKPSWYGQGSISTTDGRIYFSSALVVTYQYFEHTTGDYFSVDSYAGIDRDLIPTWNGGALTDYFDFRQDRDSVAGTFSTLGECSKPGDSIRADITFYLPRMDSIYLAPEGTFAAVTGVPSSNPVAPDVPGNSMKLYQLYIPAYTPDITLIAPTMIENKRYTMRDIGALDTRISNLEYYTTLSALEASANSIDVIDPTTGNNRFKNGIAADGFIDFRLADTTDPQFQASLDATTGTLQPTFTPNGVDLAVAALNNGKATASVYQLPYTETLIVSQPYATTTSNINPYAVFTWSGSIQLTPDSDFWKDVVYLQPIYNSISVDNTGGAREGSVTNVISQTFLYKTDNTSPVQQYVSTGDGNGTDYFQTVNLPNGTTTDYYSTSSQTTTTTFTSQSSSSVSDALVSTSPIYFMRSIDITFSATKFKPYTRLYPFFDELSVASVCKPVSGAYGDPIITDINGAVTGVFTVPNTATFNFQVGTGTFRLTDSATNANDDTVQTDGETTFLSGGTLEDREDTYTTTTVLGAQTSTTLTTGQTSVTRKTDPIAESFTVTGTGGNFITKVGIKFATKSQTVPVTLQIRTVDNGLPTLNLLVDGEVTLNPNQVTASADASLTTYFTFRNPVYLADGAEYAIVMIAETQDYNVYIAEMGDVVIGQQIALSKQPYTGVFFTSSNGSTWTPAQTQDLMFEVWAANFDPTVTATIDFGNVALPALPTKYSPIATTLSSGSLVVYMRSNGLKGGDTVIIGGAVDGNGFLATDLNGSHTVISSTIDTFTINIAGKTAAVTGSYGGSAIMITANYPFDTFYANMNDFILPGTAIDYQVQYVDSVTRTPSDFIGLNIGNPCYVPSEGVINQAANLFKIRAILSTTKTNLTPVIAQSGMTTALISNRINTDISNAAFGYVTNDVKFDNPSTSVRFYIGAYLPGSTTMIVNYKLFVTSDEDVSTLAWTPLTPTTPLVNDDLNFAEYEYDLSGVGTFVGYKIYIQLLGTDSVKTPALTDFRSIALA
jgi:hypothetical protein